MRACLGQAQEEETTRCGRPPRADAGGAGPAWPVAGGHGAWPHCAPRGFPAAAVPVPHGVGGRYRAGLKCTLPPAPHRPVPWAPAQGDKQISRKMFPSVSSNRALLDPHSKRIPQSKPLTLAWAPPPPPMHSVWHAEALAAPITPFVLRHFGIIIISLCPFASSHQSAPANNGIERARTAAD